MLDRTVGSRAALCAHRRDIYELFCMAEQRGTKFLVRTCVDRLAGDGQHTISADMRGAKVKATYRIEVRDANGTVSEATVEVRYRRLRVQPPIRKQKMYPSLTLAVIHAQERTIPQGRENVDWKLITNLPVQSRRDALEELSWYTMRWKIEAFHKILKSGCRAEASKLRAAERIVNLIAVLCILSWRIFWMTMLNRVAPAARPTVALTNVEIRVLKLLVRAVRAASGDQRFSARISPKLPVWAATLHARKILRLGTLFYGVEYRDSPTLNSDS